LRARTVLPSKHSRECGRKKIVVRTFNLDTIISPPSLLARAKKAAHDNGATLLGDERSGRFSHDMAKGEYRMAGQTVVVAITEKHWLLPWPLVEAQLRELIR
jgi:hypothetical protein